MIGIVSRIGRVLMFPRLYHNEPVGTWGSHCLQVVTAAVVAACSLNGTRFPQPRCDTVVTLTPLQFH